MKKNLMGVLVVFLVFMSAVVFAQAEELEVIVIDEAPQVVVVETVEPAEEKEQVEAPAVKAEEKEKPAAEKAPEEKPTFTLTFLTGEGEVLLKEQLKLGDRIIAPFFIPTMDGYVFEFWYDEQLADETDKIEEYRFGAGIVADTVLKPLYQAIQAKEGDDAASGEEMLLPWSLPQTGPTDEPAATALDQADDGSGSELVLVIIDDPEDDPEADDVVIPEPSFKGAMINIFSSHGVCMDEGSMIDLWAELIGFENINAALQWQYFDGQWKDVEGATATTHSFTATRESINYGWRLVATVIEGDNA